MELLRDTALEVAFVTTPITPPRHTLTVVVKATLTLPDAGVCELAAEQLPVASDVFVDDDPAKPLRYESDLAPIKPRGECLVLTGAPPPPGAVAAFALGPLRRMLSTGDGRALAPSGPVARTDPSRARLAGTFDAAWQRDRWPFLPADHDIAYHLAAPLEQRVEGFWAGDEELALRDLCPGRALVRARLPGITPKVFALRSEAGEPEALRMRLDTVVVDAPGERVIALWRGTLDVASDRLEDLHTLLIWHEPLAARSGVEQARARIAAARAKAEAELAGFVPEAVPDDDDDDAPLGGTAVLSDEWASAPADEVAAARALDDARIRIEATMAEQGVEAPEAEAPEAEAEPSEEMLGEAAAALGVPVEALRPDPEPAADERAEPAPPTARERLFAALAAGEPTVDLDLTDIDLRGARLEGVDLSGCLLAGGDFTDATLQGATLARASMPKAALTRACFDGADLTGADLTGAGGEAVSLRGATLRDAVLSGASLAGASLEGCRAERAEAREATLSGADLRGAILNGADLSGARLDGARAGGASLVGASLEGASARGIDLTRADLTKLRASEGASLASAKLREVKGAQGIYEGADLSGADLSYGVFTRAEFSRANLTGATLDGCDLKGARAVGAVLAGARVRRADAMEINLEGADLAGADLRGTSLFGAQLWKARVHGARFEQALLGGTLLEGFAETLGAR